MEIIKSDCYVTYKDVEVLKGTICDQAAQYMTEQDWLDHTEYVKELKRTGEYLKCEKYTITLKHFPLYDNPDNMRNKPVYSQRVEFIDLSKEHGK